MVFFMKFIYHRRIFKVWCIKIHTLILKFLLNFNKICLFSEEFQRFEQLIPDKDTFELLSDLMGKDSEPKHDFIFDNLDF